LYGEAAAKILTEKLGVIVSDLPTQGSVHNVKLVESGGAHLGLIAMSVGLQGWNGGDWTNGKSFRTMRALFPMYDSSFQFVVLHRSGISRLQMLDKLDIGIGPRAGVAGVYLPKILSVLGLSARLGNGSWDEMARQLLSGRYNALVLFGGVPFPAAQELEAKEPLSFISLTGAEIDLVRKALPELTPSTIAAGSYSSLDKDYTTVGVYNFAVGRSDLPEDLAYQLVKAVFENQPRLVKATSAASETVPQNAMKNTFLPFHPGAVRYYREVGIKIPDALVPAN
jgi:TRAP transporter TAXI family solute receptor